ncbi:hypothetical protein Tco_0265453 [Tanacetum coccineum]
MSKVLQERGFGILPSLTELNQRDQVKSISTTIEADSHSIRRIESSQYAVSTRQNSTLLYKSRQMTVPFPSRASVSVMPLLTYLNLGLGELAHTRLTVELADRTVKYPKGIAKNKITLRAREERIVFLSVKAASSLIKRVYMLSLRERMELDLEARLMGETLVLNRSLDPFLEDYIELNDLNEPFKLRRNQGDDLMPTIKEGEIIKEFRTRNDKLNIGIDDYPSYCDNDKKIRIDWDNVVGALMNVPIFVGTFSIVTDFAILENMEDYRDEEMGDVIFGEPFLREVGIKTRRFEWMITLYKGDDEVTYQMVSKKDEKNEISHAYQKLKGFYKGVLNLGPNYIRIVKTEEWLTRGHISVHEIE